ncbi:glycosyltransferase family 4 protein [Roseibium aggregatum]|uniref:Glycosyltransferase family 4 protein n=1 Tax=Roseibium aggregatum TaxID=187304 RepID=A0A939J3P1_9HYPH|nr:glycosyltransferase family 4 protein [Roseibium aggregatum]MBN9669869.1 glycosyltransferase family 4 protein [Roseibium aggregatum]
MACDGVGPSFTCLNILRGAVRAGYDVELFVNRRRLMWLDIPTRTAFPGPLSWLPYKFIEAKATRISEKTFMAAVQPGDIAYLWPAVSLEMHKALHERRVPVVLEGINTRMASAKKILDEAYHAAGLLPSHGITEERIAEEEEKYKYSSAIFAPNRNVELALEDAPENLKILPASYGVNTKIPVPDRSYDDKEGLTFMFCGYACVRKGVHLLLDAWRHMPPPHKLQLVGNVEPALAEKYKDVLESGRVELVGFVKDVHQWFKKADVFIFPSLEEGGPQVTYEAALHGLPIIASPMGAGRLSELPDTMIVVEPRDSDALFEAMQQMLWTSTRARFGQNAKKEARYFDWDSVGARRAAALFEQF